MESKMSQTILLKLRLADLQQSLQQAGYRVEVASDPVANIAYLRSATSGLAFDVRPGNRVAGDNDGFADVAFSAVLQVQGELPLDVVNRWNASRRFSRLQLSHPFLVFCMDVSAAGGITLDHLRSQIEIWDRLVQELIVYLREELRRPSVTADATDQVAANAAPPPKRSRAAEPDVAAAVQ